MNASDLRADARSSGGLPPRQDFLRAMAQKSQRSSLPERTCLGCRAVRPKSELIRLVLPPEGPVVVDPTGRRSGRGAYLCRGTGTTCLSQARRRRALPRALRTTADRIDADALAAALTLLTPPESAGASPAWGVGPAGSARRQSRGASPPHSEESPSPR